MADVARVTLTFDDGPSEWTAQIIDLLQVHDARATFFVIGETAAARPELLARIADEGHEIGNHTWSHPVLTDCDEGMIRTELQRTSEFLTETLGVLVTRYRAPHFAVDERVDRVAAELGLVHTPSNVSPPDWRAGWSAPLTITFVTKQITDGAIICLHDGVPPADTEGATRQPTVDAVASILTRLTGQGFSFVSATELLEPSR